MVRLLAAFLSLLVLIGTGVGAAHGHEAPADSPLVCAICHVASQAPSASGASAGFTTEAVVSLLVEPAYVVRPVRRRAPAVLGARAPPHTS